MRNPSEIMPVETCISVKKSERRIVSRHRSGEGYKINSAVSKVPKEHRGLHNSHVEEDWNNQDPSWS